MKIKLEYESETLLVPELLLEIQKMKYNILDCRYEVDKILCHVERFQTELIRWFSNNSKIE